jgi:hypothetical protein
MNAPTRVKQHTTRRSSLVVDQVKKFWAPGTVAHRWAYSLPTNLSQIAQPSRLAVLVRTPTAGNAGDMCLARNPARAAFLGFSGSERARFTPVNWGSASCGFCAAVVAWISVSPLSASSWCPLVYVAAMIQAYIAAKNFNECNGLQVR